MNKTKSICDMCAQEECYSRSTTILSCSGFKNPNLIALSGTDYEKGYRLGYRQGFKDGYKAREE